MEPPVLHLEITSACNLSCPKCPRTQFRSDLKVNDLDIETIRKLSQQNLHFSKILLSGNHGDPIYHPQFHEVITVLQNLPNSPHIVVCTNGSGQNVEWWQKTATILRTIDVVVFGIDGTESINGIYRRGAKWNSIIEGIKTLKKYGRHLIYWQWILFRYNQDHVDQGIELASTLGVDYFTIIESSRLAEKDPLRPTQSIFDVAKGC